MSRRPRRNRPPKLPDFAPPGGNGARARDGDTSDGPAPTTPRARLVAARVAGQHPRLGRAEVASNMARLVAGAPDACLGTELSGATREEAGRALAEVWGWDGVAARAEIDPSRTIAAARAAAARLEAVASGGGRIALATGRPASLLPLYRGIAAAAKARGAEILACDRCALDDTGSAALWWHDGVAVVTDGAGVLADDGVLAGPEWLFAIGRPQLVVADQGFAGAAAAAGHETIALADLDAVALGIAADRGLPLRVVPLHDGRPPADYGALQELLLEELLSHHPEPDAHGSQSTTPAPSAYAAPHSGGEG